MATFFLNLTMVDAQTFSPGFQSNLNNGWAHTTYVNTLTYAVDVNLGSQDSILRTVEARNFQSPFNWDFLGFDYVHGGNQVKNFLHPSYGGINADFHFRYFYTSDPDGSGPLQAGDEIYSHILFDVQLNQDPSLGLANMCICSPPFMLTFTADRLAYGYSNEYQYRVRMTATHSDGSTYVDEDWTGIGSHLYQINLIQVFPQPGDICVVLELLQSHNYNGQQDFTDYVVATTATETHCLYWQGLSTGVDEQDGSAASVEVQYALDQIKVMGVSANAVLRVHTATGQVVHTARASETVSTTGWTSGIYLIQVVDEATGLVETKRIFIGSGR